MWWVYYCGVLWCFWVFVLEVFWWVMCVFVLRCSGLFCWWWWYKIWLYLSVGRCFECFYSIGVCFCNVFDLCLDYWVVCRCDFWVCCFWMVFCVMCDWWCFWWCCICVRCCEFCWGGVRDEVVWFWLGLWFYCCWGWVVCWVCIDWWVVGCVGNICVWCWSWVCGRCVVFCCEVFGLFCYIVCFWVSVWWWFWVGFGLVCCNICVVVVWMLCVLFVYFWVFWSFGVVRWCRSFLWRG